MHPTLFSRNYFRFCLALACLLSLLAFSPRAAHADIHLTITMPATVVAGQPIAGTVTGTSVGADALTAVNLAATLVTPQGQTTVLTPTSTSLPPPIADGNGNKVYTLNFTYVPASGGTLTVMAQVAVTSAQPYRDQATATVTGLPSVAVSTGNTWLPNPGSVNQPITSTVPATVSNPYQSPNGDTISQHWTWTTDGVYESDTGLSGSFTPYGGNSTVTWSEGSPSTLFTGTFGDVGYYIVKVTATLTYHDDTTNVDVGAYSGDGYIGGVAADLAPPPAGPTAHVMSAHEAMQPHNAGAPPPAPGPPTGIPIAPKVTLPPLIKLGLYSKNNAIVNITVQITPAAKAGTVTFSVIPALAPNQEAASSSAPPDANGNVVVTLYALNPTPGSPTDKHNLPNGDEQLVATVGTQQIASANILVLEPYSLDPTPSNGSGVTVTGVNTLQNNKSIPADIAVIFPSVAIAKDYNAVVTMQVRDQFGQPLNAIFAGTDILEIFDGATGSINSPLTANGTYTDSVGFSELSSFVAADKTNPFAQEWYNNSGYPTDADKAAIPGLPSTKAGVDAMMNLSPPSQTKVQKIRVFVGSTNNSIELNPKPTTLNPDLTAVNRTITSTPLNPPQSNKVNIKVQPN